LRLKTKESDKIAHTTKMFGLLKKTYGEPVVPLNYRRPHELAIAVILSAQCTDERVNQVTPPLFKRYPRIEDYFEGSARELEKMIFSTGFYKNKARSIRGFCRELVEKYNGKIPRQMNELIKMPGIGRKSANVILQVLYNEPSGVVVDTHVARISGLLGLTESKNPVIIERDLMQTIHKKYWINWSLYMIYLGRSYCKARQRNCARWPLQKECPSAVFLALEREKNV